MSFSCMKQIIWEEKGEGWGVGGVVQTAQGEDDWGSPDLSAKSEELLLPSAYSC